MTLELPRESFEKFSNFLVAFAPRFAVHLDHVFRPSFNYGFGVDGVHFRASFKYSSTTPGFTLTFEESSLNPNSVEIICTLAEDGRLLGLEGSNITPDRAERIFSVFRQIVQRHSFLL